MLCKQIILITGPTATGKTEVSLEIADHLPNVEIVSADSRQIYNHMNIGTAKPDKTQLDCCPHHFIDIIDPDESYNAGEFSRMAKAKLGEIWSGGGIPVVVGGTGLYWQSLLDGFFPDQGDYGAIRSELMRRWDREGLGGLYDELRRMDPLVHSKIEPGDTQRILRALEVASGGAEPLSKMQELPMPKKPAFKAHMFYLTIEREILHKRIGERVERMLAAGLVDEVRELLQRGYDRKAVAMGTLGYAEILDYIEGKMALVEAADLIKTRTRQFAKRQMTWCRRDRRLRELNLSKWGQNGVIQRIVESWDYGQRVC